MRRTSVGAIQGRVPTRRRPKPGSDKKRGPPRLPARRVASTDPPRRDAGGGISSSVDRRRGMGLSSVLRVATDLDRRRWTGPDIEPQGCLDRPHHSAGLRVVRGALRGSALHRRTANASDKTTRGQPRGGDARRDEHRVRGRLRGRRRPAWDRLHQGLRVTDQRRRSVHLLVHGPQQPRRRRGHTDHQQPRRHGPRGRAATSTGRIIGAAQIVAILGATCVAASGDGSVATPYTGVTSCTLPPAAGSTSWASATTPSSPATSRSPATTSATTRRSAGTTSAMTRSGPATRTATRTRRTSVQPR